MSHQFHGKRCAFYPRFAGLPEVTLGLLSEEPLTLLPVELQQKIRIHQELQSVYEAEALANAVQKIVQETGIVHRIIGAVEQLQVPIAEVRELLGIEGMKVETAMNFRDKARMKNLLRAAGLPCARHRMVSSLAEAKLFAQEFGFPFIVKPPDGAGSKSTFKVRNPFTLEQALRSLNVSTAQPVLLEEFIIGAEHSFDTFSLNGKPVFHSLTHYIKSFGGDARILDSMASGVAKEEVDSAQYDDIRRYAFQTLEVLGMQTGFSHLEWFRRKDGSIAISEVAARPPGAQFPTLISRANDFNALDAWANLMVFGQFDPPERKYAAGAAYLRGQGQGKQVVAIQGLDHLEQEIGHLVTDVKLPQIGQEASPSYEGEGYIIIRHPETEVVKQALKKIVSVVRVHLG
ncbi:MAG: ATP-grasp domain-containing protein [Saprospiraceae bacterium]|nr:ATP-grasp domain-containing protein [Saprospiraceae bacterium]